MLAKNVLFVGLVAAGLTWLTVSLLPADRAKEPKNFHPNWRNRADVQRVISEVNRQFREAWQTEGLQPTDRASDLVIARRLSLGLTGTVPSVEELRTLESKDEEDRVDWWVSRILEDRRYADYVAERLARSYVGTEDGPFIVYRRRRFVSWLSDRLHEHMPYDRVVRSLLTESGLWTDSPPVNFVTVTVDQNNSDQPDPIRLAARTSRAFLGMRIDCLQCHDDNLGTIELGEQVDPRYGTQQDFHQLAAFFSETRSSFRGIDDQQKNKDYRYTFLGEDNPETVPAVVPYMPELVNQRGNRREQLASWVTHPKNKPFARAIVNRVWALMFGRPLAEPIDDLPLYGKFPPGLEVLADDLIENQFDLRRLIRLIAQTEVFQMDSRATSFEVTEAHEQSLAVFPLTRLRPEQMAGGLIQTSSLSTIDSKSHILSQLIRFSQEMEFIRRYGDTGEDEFAEHGGTIPQRLVMMNGDLLTERTRGSMLLNNAASQIAALAPDSEKAVETVYLAVLTRHPTNRELEYFSAELEKSESLQQRIHYLEDLYWVLLNSSEFSWNH